VRQAVRTALDESAGSRFDVRANVYTLVAITGVVLYWRGVWSLWCVIAGDLKSQSLLRGVRDPSAC